MVTRTIHLEDWPVAPAEQPTPVPGSLVVWRKRLAEARERGGFSKIDIQAIGNLNTCAVGEYLGFPLTPTEANSHYSDHLWTLGLQACDAVSNNHFDAFAAILDTLESLPRNVERNNP